MIKIICLGNIKEAYLSDAIKEYSKRLSKYCELNIIELDDVGIDDVKVALKKEEEKLLKVINQKDYIITLEIDGKELTSPEFSKKIEDTLTYNSNITFIIGGSYGLSDNIKQLSNFKLSFSRMTFPHQLFRVILLEQLYRAFKIMNNESYHK